MSYYRGDYYRGGFFGSLFRGIGGIAKGILGIPSAPAPVVIQQGPTNPFGAGMSSLGPVANQLVSRGKAIISKHPVLSAAAAAGALAAGAGGVALARRGGKGTAVMTPAGVVMRKRRRMHVTNVRALRRAIRRTHGFAKLAMKVIRIEHPRKKGKFGGYRRRKRS